ncbi:ribosomal protein S18 acetylase RimI-like enzyme [Actinopolyspora lacussalsi]|nr:ribosomal protein S18 acetylase RimI-like enzyme [Actinopolyspora lacussalsi]
MNSIEIIDGTRTHVDAAAQVWTIATRDGDATPPPPGRSAATHPTGRRGAGGTLLVASTTTETVGFLAAKPRGNGCPSDEAEVRYLGVAPHVWGERIGSRLAQALPEHLGPEDSPEHRSRPTPTTNRPPG